MRALILAPLVAVAATTTAITPAPAAARFDAIAFFTGHTEGTGRMKILFGPHRAVRVHGVGRVGPDGVLVLAQTVERGGHAEQREWRIRATTPDHYSGTLSDARGPIQGEATVDRLHLWYRAKNGVAIEQWLVLASDGRSAQNRLTARMAGVVVARLDEAIRKTD